MNTLILLAPVLVLVLSSMLFLTPASAQNLSFPHLYHPGIQWAWKINTGNYTFVVNTTSNYDMQNVKFDANSKTLTFLGNSSHTGNIAEIVFPTNLIGGNYTTLQDGKLVTPIVLKNGNNTTFILKFNDSGKVTTNITGTTYLPEFSGIAPAIMAASFVMVLVTLRYRR